MAKIDFIQKVDDINIAMAQQKQSLTQKVDRILQIVSNLSTVTHAPGLILLNVLRPLFCALTLG